ncbi:MAG: hypothetical protein AAF290_13275 [Pseudomonadota bacterium]
MKRHIAFVTTALIALSGCSSVGGYVAAPTPDDYGYSDEVVDAQTYRVHFNAKQILNTRRLADYTLRRAAEVTVENGYDWFSIVEPGEPVTDTGADKPANYSFMPARQFTGLQQGPGRANLRNMGSVTNSPNITGDPSERPLDGLTIEIYVGAGEVPADGFAYDAKGILGIPAETT